MHLKFITLLSIFLSLVVLVQGVAIAIPVYQPPNSADPQLVCQTQLTGLITTTLVHVDAILGLILSIPILGAIISPVSTVRGILFAISFSAVDTICHQCYLTALQPCLGALNISPLDPAQPTNHEAFLGCIIDEVIPCLTKLPVSGLGK